MFFYLQGKANKHVTEWFILRFKLIRIYKWSVRFKNKFKHKNQIEFFVSIKMPVPTYKLFKKRLEGAIIKSMGSKRRAFTTGYFSISSNLAKHLRNSIGIKGIATKSDQFNNK